MDAVEAILNVAATRRLSYEATVRLCRDAQVDPQLVLEVGRYLADHRCPRCNARLKLADLAGRVKPPVRGRALSCARCREYNRVAKQHSRARRRASAAGSTATP